MRRFLGMFMAGLLVLSLCACSEATITKSETPNEESIQVADDLAKAFSDLKKEASVKDLGRDHHGGEVMQKVAQSLAESGGDKMVVGDIYNSETLPKDDYKMTIEGDFNGKHLEAWVAVRGNERTVRIGTKIDDQNLLTRLFTKEGGTYFHYTGWLEGEKSKAFYSLPDSIDTELLKSSVTIETFGFDASKITSMKSLGVVDGYNAYTLVAEDGQEFTYFADVETGATVGLDFVSDDAKYSIRFVETSDQDFDFLADVNVAVPSETEDVAHIMSVQLDNVLSLAEG